MIDILPRPHPIIPYPKPMRLPKGKRMTIAIGLLCNEGLVIGADTEEVLGGYIKTSTEKMRVIEKDNYKLIITGAGESDFIDCFYDELEEALDESEPKDIKAIYKILRTTQLQYFRNHLAPYSSFPSDDRPNPDLLIALHIRIGGLVTGSTLFRTVLFKANGTVVKRIHKAECVGTGVVLARSLMDQFFDPELSLKQTGILAAYILRQAKRWGQYCGGNSDIAILSNSEKKTAGIPAETIKSLERHFDEFAVALKPVLINCADTSVDEKHFKAILGKFQSDMDVQQLKFFNDILIRGLSQRVNERWRHRHEKKSRSRKSQIKRPTPNGDVQ
jgi:20S proteasome alpha/beta subunit